MALVAASTTTEPESPLFKPTHQSQPRKANVRIEEKKRTGGGLTVWLGKHHGPHCRWRSPVDTAQHRDARLENPSLGCCFARDYEDLPLLSRLGCDIR